MRIASQTFHTCATAALLFLLPAADATGQIRYDRGQNVAPVYEGWIQNADGTFTMVFGYMNRNYQEMPEASIGSDNGFEPGPVDRGQPTRFYTRRQQFVFEVPVPADWGEQDLVWTLTTNGQTAQAFGSLWPSWEIDDGVIRANRGMGARGAPADNQHPAIRITEGTDLTVTLPDTLTLTAIVSDDGIPGARPRRNDTAADDDAARAAQLAAARARQASRRHPTNQAIVDARVAGETGLGVTWLHYRGPGAVRFSPISSAIEGGRGGEATTTITFSEPGTHVVRAYADDTINTTPIDITVTVVQ
jgi:hypothetical protein